MNVQLINVQETETNSSAFSETCLATKVQKSFTKTTMFHTTTPAETCFAVLLHMRFCQTFQPVRSA